MALINVTASEVAPVQIVEQFTAPVGTSTSKGDYVRVSATNGRWTPGQATKVSERGDLAGIAIRSKATAGEVTAVIQGIVDLGKGALNALNYGDKVYLSDSLTGQLSSTTGTVSTGCAVVGVVQPAFGSTTADKVLRVNIRPQNFAG